MLCVCVRARARLLTGYAFQLCSGVEIESIVLSLVFTITRGFMLHTERRNVFLLISWLNYVTSWRYQLSVLLHSSVRDSCRTFCCYFCCTRARVCRVCKIFAYIRLECNIKHASCYFCHFLLTIHRHVYIALVIIIIFVTQC